MVSSLTSFRAKDITKTFDDYINPLMNFSASATGAPFLSSEIALMQDFFHDKTNLLTIG